MVKLRNELRFHFLQKPLILEVKGTKIGFLGYCDSSSEGMYKNCTETRMLFNSGPAVYTDGIATRDVHKLRKVENKNRKKLSYSSLFSLSDLKLALQ